MNELLPRKASFAPGEAVRIEVRGAATGTVRIWHLGVLVSETSYAGGEITLQPLPEGGYSVELGELTTAIEIAADSRARLRYGFVASYAPDKDVAGVSDLVRRLHLTGVMFYDWAWRHADLMGGGEQYDDPLGQPISLGTVRRLIDAVHGAGSRALGYAAVYGVGPGEWADWSHAGLLKADGSNWSLGDFLYVVDPAAPDWLRHFTGDLVKATSLGFDGFHLDQYGWPKAAIRADGALVDTGASFVTLIEGVRAALPDAHLVFNNVNDFPTRLTARTAQDAVYIEPWEPQLTLQSLADTVTRARLYGEGKPVVLAAYQHVYETAGTDAADRATALTMAMLFSHGATQILAGEADRLLTDPYYVRNWAMAPSTQALLKRWYDFLVAHDELLMPPSITEITHSYVGGYNGDLDVSFGAGTSETATAGKIWRRVTRAGNRLVVHLINLADQGDTLWDAPREAFAPRQGTLRVRRLKDRTPIIRVADPDGLGRLVDLSAAIDGEAATVELPPLQVWQLITIDL
jgi:dextranase